jgi:hypothetical protein
MCATGEANRRVIVTAIVNCGSTPVSLHADARGILAAAFGRLFLTLPANPITDIDTRSFWDW